jgi:ATP-dependent helicase/DNAse subunit B
MSSRFTILCGPARSGKTQRLLTRYRAALAQQPPGSTLWLAPNWRAAAEVRQRLLDGTLAGCFSPGVMTFGKFAEVVLHAAGVPLRPVTRLMKRELIRQILADQAAWGRLTHFHSIAGTPGLTDLVCEFIGELKRLEIWPEDFHRACAARGVADKDVELFEVYAAYQQTLRERGLFDAEGRFWSARDLLQRAEGGRRKAEQNDECGMMNDELGAVIHHSSFIIHHSLVVADGFTDFTRTQHEILEILAGRAAEMFITLPLEAVPRRADLFAKPLKTLDELRQRHSHAHVEELARPADAPWPAIAHLEQTLFANPRDRDRLAAAGTAACTDGIEILAAAKQLGEIEMIAARIKRLLIDGQAWPGEIALVFRSVENNSELLHEVFGRLGIPVAIEAGQPLDRSPALRALVALLQLDLDDWPFDRLLAILGSNYFQPEGISWEDGRAAVERTIRGLQIPHGRDRLIEQLSDIKPRPSVATGGTTTDCGPTSATAGHGFVLTIVKRLAAALDALPERATLPDWANAWRRLAQETGLLRVMDSLSPLPLGEGQGEGGAVFESQSALTLTLSQRERGPFASAFSSDHCAWTRLMDALAEGDTLAAWLDERPPELDRRAAFETLLDIIGGERVGHAGDESGQVRALSAASIRSLRIPYVFLAGLSEKAFPPPQREDRLYSEAEYLRLIDAGLPLVARSLRTREEMLLFYEAVTRATRRLYLSYAALDESAQPLLPSPFLAEVEQAFGPGRIPRVERQDLSPIPQDDEPLCCEADFRVKAMATALDGNVSLLAGLFQGERGERREERGDDRESSVSGTGRTKDGSRTQIDDQRSVVTPAPLSSLLSPLSSSLAAGLELIDLRQDRDRFGPAEGILQSDVAHDYMAVRFPPQHIFSATDLERYASCPFRFFLERVLKIEPIEDLALEFDVLRRGRVVHDVLATFHRRVNERLGRPASPLELDAAEFDALLAVAIQDSLPPEPANPLQAALREVDRRLVVEWLGKYREQTEKYDALWKDFDTPMAAELFEVSFGRGDQPPPSVDRPLEFARDGQTYRISGRIDRIDTGVVAGEAALNIVDYKTGGSIAFSADTIKAGATLQLPLYAIAAMELLLADRDVIPWRAGYWYVREGGFKPRQALRMYRNDDGRIELDPAWEDLRAGLGDTVAGLIEAIRGGRFPVCSADDRCTGHCPFNTICRINQVRSLEKTCRPTVDN